MIIGWKLAPPPLTLIFAHLGCKKQGANGEGLEHLILFWKVYFVWAFCNRLHPLDNFVHNGSEWNKRIRSSTLPEPQYTHTHAYTMHFKVNSPQNTQHIAISTEVIPCLGPCSHFIFHNPFLAANRTALSSFAAKKKFPSSSHYSILISFLLQALSTPLCTPRFQVIMHISFCYLNLVFNLSCVGFFISAWFYANCI